MADALRAIDRVAADFRAALTVHLIETSPRLRAIQAERLPDAVWHTDLDGLPHAPVLLLANEFLDALPIRQFVQRNGIWLERFVEDGRFEERRSDCSPTPPAATIVEICEPALALAGSLGARFA